MSHLRQTIIAIGFAVTAIGALAQTDSQVDTQHKQHQANVLATEQESTARDTSASTPASAERMATMDRKMKAMDEMHKKMMAAKTPKGRKAMMAEHMKAMQDGMQSMSMMGGADVTDMQGKKPMQGNMGQHHEMMEKRMAMMESMMQMMMDQMPAPASN
jgi:hypothetical protein